MLVKIYVGNFLLNVSNQPWGVQGPMENSKSGRVRSMKSIVLFLPHNRVNTNRTNSATTQSYRQCVLSQEVQISHHVVTANTKHLHKILLLFVFLDWLILCLYVHLNLKLIFDVLILDLYLEMITYIRFLYYLIIFLFL